MIMGREPIYHHATGPSLFDARQTQSGYKAAVLALALLTCNSRELCHRPPQILSIFRKKIKKIDYISSNV